EDIQDFYLRSWRAVGFEDSYQEETYKKAGLEQLRQFVERQNAQTMDAQHIASEQSFSLELEDVVLEGRIDQINQLNGTTSARSPGIPDCAGATPLLPYEFSASSMGHPDAAIRKFPSEDHPSSRETRAGAPSVVPAVKVELIDYKTGRPRSQKDADKSLQLSIYALAARRQLKLNP